MAPDKVSTYQKFIDNHKSVAEAITSSCKNRLRSNPKMNSEEIFTSVSREFSDVYYEDKKLWIAYLRKTMPKILLEIRLEAQEEISNSKQKRLAFEERTTGMPNEIQQGSAQQAEHFEEIRILPTSLSHLPGDVRIEKQLPRGDKDGVEKPIITNIVIPKPGIIEDEKKETISTDLGFAITPVSKKELDKKIDNHFPFGRPR